MAIFSPALVIAMCVLFVLTRIHRHMFIFEVPLFFGLKYCLQPDVKVLDSISESGKNNANTNGHNSNNNKSTNSSSTSASASDSASSSPSSHQNIPLLSRTGRKLLPIRRAFIAPDFFSLAGELPYLAALHNMLSLTIAYFFAAALEVAFSCTYPGFLMTSRSSYLAITAIVFIAVHLWRLSLFLSSPRVMLLITATCALAALIISAALSNPALVSVPHAAHAAYITLRARLSMSHAEAESIANGAASILRVVLVSAAAALAGAVVIPARRFSLTDSVAIIALHNHDDDDHDNIYNINDDHDDHDGEKNKTANVDNINNEELQLTVDKQRPKASKLIKIAFDYVVPALALTFVALTPRHSLKYDEKLASNPLNPIFGTVASPQSFWWWFAWSSSPRSAVLPASRVLILLLSCLLRLGQMRVRLQSYLDGVIDTFRKFWTFSTSSSSSDEQPISASTVVRTISGTAYYLPMIAVAYIGPILITVLLLSISLVNGDIAPSICPRSAQLPTMPAKILVAETSFLLACVVLSAYMGFAIFSLAIEVVVSTSKHKRSGQQKSIPRSSTGSERRRQKRLLQQHQQQQRQSRKQR